MTCTNCGSQVHPPRACPACGLVPTGAPAAQPDRTAPGPTTPDLEETGLGLEAAFVDPDVTRVPTPARRSLPEAADGAEEETNVAPGGPRPATDGRPGAGRPAGAGTAEALVGRQLGPRYHIFKLLGAGGMGAVYQAWDAELGVAVALKTILPDVAADPETVRMLERRFKQELLLARKVTHKNIVRVHDIGEVEGVKYITMSFIEGEDLATVLKREGKLPLPRVMTIARSVVAGLQAAHAVDVVHRDLKPANIMLGADGEGLIMDFGIARSTAEGPASGSAVVPGVGHVSATSAQTMAGSVVGTIEYMAPEQARAEPVDQRADIYAFGLIVYDLLLGKVRATRTNSAFDELRQRMQTAPPAPHTQDASVPPAIDELVVRCLQPDPAQRFQSTSELVAALNRLDDRGMPLPLVRRLTRKGVAAAAAAMVVVVGATWWFAQPPPAPVQHAPMSILIADLANTTGEAAFDGTFEPMLKLVLEETGFISAYDRNGIRRSLGVAPPDRLDATAGREVAVKQGVGVVLSGSLARDGGGYVVALQAAESVTGNVITTASGRAARREDLLAAATAAGNRVRRALGDDTSDSAQRFAAETISAASLDVVREYADAMQALSNGKFAEARAGFARAAVIDPGFGMAYSGQAIAAQNLGQPQDAQALMKEAIRHVDRMTERERFRVRGLYYYITNDYQACVQQYNDLLARYASDAAARNNLALCSTKLRDMKRAREEMQNVVQLLPKRSLYRVNASLYSAYSGDFATAEQEAQVAQDLGDPWAKQALALAKQGRGDLESAAAAYRALGSVAGAGPSYTASGLADVAAYQGRFSDAAAQYADGAKADLADNDRDRAAAKLAGLAYVELARARPRQARAAADEALKQSSAAQIKFLAGRILAQTGAAPQARAIAADLSKELQAEPQAYGKVLEGVIALEQKDPRLAVKLLSEAISLLDTWIGRFDLGRAYLAAGALPQADAEFDRCLARSGEALSLFLDEEPTSAFLPPALYYQGRVREAMNSVAFAESYRRYLAIREKAGEDPLLEDIRRRTGS
jgi:eukaryotic-like serine/threonine-protein kinase